METVRLEARATQRVALPASDDQAHVRAAVPEAGPHLVGVFGRVVEVVAAADDLASARHEPFLDLVPLDVVVVPHVYVAFDVERVGGIQHPPDLEHVARRREEALPAPGLRIPPVAAVPPIPARDPRVLRRAEHLPEAAL